MEILDYLAAIGLRSRVVCFPELVTISRGTKIVFIFGSSTLQLIKYLDPKIRKGSQAWEQERAAGKPPGGEGNYRRTAWERERREKGDDVTTGATETIIIDNKKACFPFRREFKSQLVNWCHESLFFEELKHW